MSGDATVDRSPEDLRAERAVEPRPLAWWGVILTIAVGATMYAAMYFSYVYIRIGVSRWPPEGIPAPPLGLPGLSVAALLASAAVLWVGLRRSHRGQIGAERVGLLFALLLAGAHVALLAADWGRAPFPVDAHSYAALYYTLPMIHVGTLAIAVLMAAVHLALSFRPGPLPRRGIGLRALGAYWYFVALGGAALLAVVYLTPHVWPRL